MSDSLPYSIVQLLACLPYASAEDADESIPDRVVEAQRPEQCELDLARGWWGSQGQQARAGLSWVGRRLEGGWKGAGQKLKGLLLKGLLRGC